MTTLEMLRLRAAEIVFRLREARENRSGVEIDVISAQLDCADELNNDIGSLLQISLDEYRQPQRRTRQTDQIIPNYPYPAQQDKLSRHAGDH